MLATLTFLVGGCQISGGLSDVNSPSAPARSLATPAPDPFHDPDGLPSEPVNTEALAALAAATTAATQAARLADATAVETAVAQAFHAALVAKAPPALVSHDGLEPHVISALTDGIAAASDDFPPGSPRLQAAVQGTLSAAQAAGYPVDARKAAAAISVALTPSGRFIRGVAAAITADPKSAAAQVTAAIRQAPAQAAEIVRAAFAAAPAEHAAIGAAATAATADTPYAVGVASAIREENSDRTLRDLITAVLADPANAARHVSAALGRDRLNAVNLVGHATLRAPKEAPAIVAAALEVRLAWQAPYIAAAAIVAAPQHDEAIRRTAVRTAQRLGLSSSVVSSLRSISAANARTLVFQSNWGKRIEFQVMTQGAPSSGSGGGGSGGFPSPFTVKNREFATVKVLYGTDRTPVLPLREWREKLPMEGSDFLFFGPDRDKTITGLRYGRCFVSIPQRHVLGEMERPGLLSRESIVKHVMLRGITELKPGDFENELGTHTRPDPGQTTGKDAFIFIHGFNVTFNQAVMRAAQMAYDFGFLGAPVVYSWSSAGSVSPQAMQHDPENVMKTRENLRKFVLQVQRHTEGNVHLVAHSMGNRALVEVLKQLADDWVDARSRIDLRPGRNKLFGEIVLAAPDVPDDWFETKHALAVKALADRVSLYVADDHALHFSKLSGNNRLGLAGPDMFIADGVQTINAAGADNDWFSLRHGYAYDVPQVLKDLRAILVNRAKPDESPRSLFHQRIDDGRSYWSVLRTVPEKARPAPKLK